MISHTLRALLFAPLLLALACTHGAKVSAPDGFAELEPGEEYSYRATSASGVVIGVRTEDNDPNGNLEFWTAALDYKLQKAGYAPMDKAASKVKSDAGMDGRRLRYEIQRNGRPHEYWVTVFVAGDSVVVVEAAGDQAFFDGATQKQIDVAVRTVKLG